MDKENGKKSRINSANVTPMRCSSSTDSDEFTPCTNDPNRVSLQIITNPSQSNAVETAFKSIVNRLDPKLNIITVSESSNVSKSTKDCAPNRNQQRLPSLSIVLFFNENNSSSSNDNDFFCDAEEDSKIDNNAHQVRKIFDTFPWRFHHKVAVTGKLTTCDSNVQDYFEYNPNFQPSKEEIASHELLDNEQCLSFPLWGIRKVHYGKRILRFTCFSSLLNWEDQINFYKLILREEETKVRDDFCFFHIFSDSTTIVQFGLKKLPTGLKPEVLKSSILQFKVKNVGHLVPLLPHSCEPISTLRWRTRDHDNNTVLLQIQCSPHDVGNEKNFAENVFAGFGTPEGFSPIRGPSPIISRGTSPNISRGARSTPTTPNLESKIHGINRGRVQNGNDSTPSLGDSFVCPELPEKMPLLKPALYCIRKSNTSSQDSNSPERNSKHDVLLKPSKDLKTNKTVPPSTISTKKRPKSSLENKILKVQNRKTEAFYV